MRGCGPAFEEKSKPADKHKANKKWLSFNEMPNYLTQMNEQKEPEMEMYALVPKRQSCVVPVIAGVAAVVVAVAALGKVLTLLMVCLVAVIAYLATSFLFYAALRNQHGSPWKKISDESERVFIEDKQAAARAQAVEILLASGKLLVTGGALLGMTALALSTAVNDGTVHNLSLAHAQTMLLMLAGIIFLGGVQCIAGALRS